MKIVNIDSNFVGYLYGRRYLSKNEIKGSGQNDTEVTYSVFDIVTGKNSSVSLKTLKPDMKDASPMMVSGIMIETDTATLFSLFQDEKIRYEDYAHKVFFGNGNEQLHIGANVEKISIREYYECDDKEFEKDKEIWNFLSDIEDFYPIISVVAIKTSAGTIYFLGCSDEDFPHELFVSLTDGNVVDLHINLDESLHLK